jgi:hypothetical protein
MLAAATAPARAATILITAEAGITADGLVDWGLLGVSGTVVADPSTIAIGGLPGYTITADGPGLMERRDQNGGWSGNFAPGEELLWTANTAGALDLIFNQPITGFGAQIQRDSFGAFTATISAFDAFDNLLGTFNLLGNSASTADDSAIFIGILSSLQDISRIRLSVDGGTQDFAINGPRIQAEAVPEPTTLVLLGIGAMAGARSFRKRRG